MNKTYKQEKFFEGRKKRVIKLNGGIKIELPTKFYSVKDKRKKKGGICLYYREIEIRSFGNGVTALTIERYASEYELNLREKKRKKRKREGKKIVEPGKKMEGFMEAIEERNALIKRKRLENKEDKETFFKRSYSGKWR